MDEDQERLLEEAKRNVKEQAYFMREAIDNAKIRDALKRSSNMLNELRTEDLSPKNYYMLFMQIFDELRVLEGAFKEEFKRGRRISDLYENVQHAGNLVPRLYLLITVGSVYINSHEVPAKDILIDLLEMMKGVQHPIKGLFLRYYFLKMCKDKLPDKGTEYEGEGGDFTDAINIILTNLEEMNKLWIKVQTIHGKDKATREKERNDLKVTIGENLVRLSQLEGCTLEVYKEVVLKKIIDILCAKDDKISQQYLMDCVIQAFPDEYHIHTLETLLQTCAMIMRNNVDIKTIFIRLMDRLADFAANSEEDVSTYTQGLELFTMFKNNIDSIIENQSDQVELKKILELQVAFLKFSSQCYPGNVEYVNSILKSCCVLCQKQGGTQLDEESLKSVVKLLTLPLDSLSFAVLQMDEFPKLMKYLPFQKRRTVALKICQAITNSAIPIISQNMLWQITDFISPILLDSKELADLEPTEFEEEQQLIARLPHLVHHDNPDEVFKMLDSLKTQFYNGGTKRQYYSLPSLFFAYIRLARYTHECLLKQHEHHEGGEAHEGQQGGEEQAEEEQPSKIYDVKKKHYKGEFHLKFRQVYDIMREIIGKLAQDHPDLCFKLYLELSHIINECDPHKEFDEETYNLFTEALEIYQNDIIDAEEKIKAIAAITSALTHLTCLSEDNFDSLASNVASYCGQLLKKTDQCIAVLNSSHLFFCPGHIHENKVMECFKRAIKITEANFTAYPNEKSFKLYVAILNKFLYYFSKEDFHAITSEDIHKCLALIKSKLEKLKDKNDLYLRNTVNFVEFKKKDIHRFQEIEW